MSRSSESARVRAVDRISQVTKLAPMVSRELQHVLEGPAFRNSKRCREFLRFVVENALEGRFDNLKERIIGSCLFGRQPDYDTGVDAIVRVVANETRHRLERHYAGGNSTSGIRIELPPGSYVPEVRKLENEQPDRLDGAPPKSDTVPSLGAQVARARLSLRSDVQWTVLWCMVAATAIGLCFLLWMQNRELRRRLQSSPQSTSLPPWSAIFAQGSHTRLILGDTSIGGVQVLLKTRFSLPQYLDGRLLPVRDQRDLGTASFIRYLAGTQFTSASYARVALNIARLAEKHSHPLTVCYARDVSLRVAREEGNLVLVGTARANPWIELVSPQLNFVLEYGTASDEPLFRNRSPQAGEPGIYVPTTGQKPGAAVTYGHVAFLPNRHNSGHVLVVSGTSSPGTEAAGDLVTDLGRWRELLAATRLCGDEPGGFEILLRVTRKSEAPVQSEVIAARVGRSARGPRL